MRFTHDTESALANVVALVNTQPGSRGDSADGLPDAAALATFLDDWQWSGARTGTAEELAEIHDLRPRLRALWESDEAGAVEILNQLLRESAGPPQLVDHDQLGWHIHATDWDAPLVERMAAEAAMAFVDVLRAYAFDRLHICAADDCDWVFIDLSKNRSRRYCDGGCGNRANVAAYRARQG